MILYICCAGGMTSSMFCKNISKKTNMTTYVNNVGSVLKNLDEIKDKYELIIMYGPATYFKKNTIETYHLENELIGIWIATQVRYFKISFEKLVKSYYIPIESIDMKLYGSMDGSQGWKEIQTLFLNRKTK